jgi:hypothetical protein
LKFSKWRYRAFVSLQELLWQATGGEAVRDLGAAGFHAGHAPHAIRCHVAMQGDVSAKWKPVAADK